MPTSFGPLFLDPLGPFATCLAQVHQVARCEGRLPATGGAMHLELEQGAGFGRGHRWRIETVPASGAPSTVAAGTSD